MSRPEREAVAEPPSFTSRRRGALSLFLTVVVGAGLRLVWPYDIEYKYDEYYMFERAQKVGRTEPLPRLGMLSGAGKRNPALSVWTFVALGRLASVRTPPDLARAVQVLNVLALMVAALLAVEIVEPESRAAWKWGVALASVNPFAVILHRKIWAQSTLPLLCVMLLCAWYRRDRRWGAFLWGLTASLLGQIHMSGFFFAAGLLLWTAVAAVRERPSSWVDWRAWGAGSALGLIPMWPWVFYMLKGPHGSAWGALFAIDGRPFLNSLYWQFWVTDALGIGAWYHLGYDEFKRFLGYPNVLGKPIYLVGLIHIALGALGLWVLVSAALRFWRRLGDWKLAVTGSGSPTCLTLAASLIGCGVLLSTTVGEIYRHYLVITFPLEWVWLAGLSLRIRGGQRILSGLWLAQLTLSILLLWYLHVNHGAPSGDFGVSYGSQ